MKSTGIGSLPHHNVDSALDYSFRHDLPFLPQLPLKNPEEMMVYQTLFGFPGLTIFEGKPILNLKEYVKKRDATFSILEKALSANNYESFLPTPTEYSCFAPFLFELQERNCSEAKIQITGHLTSGLVLMLEDGEALKDYPQILNDVYKWTMAKGLALIQSLKQKNIKPILFIDEPILTIFKERDPRFISGLSEISMLTFCFKKAGAEVGLHCCGNTVWSKVLELPLDYLSFDVLLSGQEILMAKKYLQSYLERGGKLALGLLPTQMLDQASTPVNIKELLAPFLFTKPTLVSCACGLGLKTPEQAEIFLNHLKEST